MFPFKVGSTSQSVYVKLVDSTTFLGKTGLLYSDVTASYVVNGAAAADVTEITLASAGTAWSSGGFIEVEATKCPGLYRFDIPNAALAAGKFVVVTFKATGVKDEAILINLYAYDPYDAAALGLTGLATAAALATVASYIDTEVAAIKAKTDNLPSDPADASDVAAALAVIGGYVDTEIAAIKAKTDNLPSDPADQSDLAALIALIPAAVATASASSPITVDVRKINGVTINGTGVAGDEFQP